MGAEAFASRKAERARQAALELPIDLTREDCKLMAIQQFTCEYIPQVAINCKPLWRVFQICGGRSFEVTPFAVINEATGEATIKPEVAVTTGKNWHDIHPALP